MRNFSLKGSIAPCEKDCFLRFAVLSAIVGFVCFGIGGMPMRMAVFGDVRYCGSPSVFAGIVK